MLMAKRNLKGFFFLFFCLSSNRLDFKCFLRYANDLNVISHTSGCTTAHTHTHTSRSENMNRSFMNNGLDGINSAARHLFKLHFQQLVVGCIVSSRRFGVYALSADENIFKAFVYWFTISMTALVFDSSGNFSGI